jgi:type I restriction enzyme, S subunit
MPLTRFSDVVTLSTTRTADPLAARIERFVGLEHIEPENLHIRSWGNVVDGTSFTQTFKSGQVLFGKRRAYQRKVAVADFDGVCSSDIYVFESNDPDKLLPELLPFICQSEGFYQYALKTSAGSLSPRTNWSHLANYEFTLPPLDEQHHIAQLLWAVDDAIQAKRNALASLSEVFKSAQTELILGRQHNHTKKSCPLGEIPTDWDWTELGKLGEFSNGISKPGSDFGSGSPFINLQDVFGKLVIDSLPEGRVKVSKKELVSQGVLKNDILFVRSSVKREGVGLTVLIDSDWNGEEVGFAGFLIRFRLTSDLVNPKFANYLFHEVHFRRLLVGSSTESLNTNINQQQLKKLPFIIPPIEVQNEVCDKLDSIAENIKAVEKHIEATNALKLSILSQYLG